MRALHLAVVLLVTGMCGEAFAQSGRVVGRVTEAGSGAEMPGANVHVEGTTVGAVADLNGRFIVTGAPPGEQAIIASYVGFAPDTVVVNIPPGGEVEANFELSWIAARGGEVVITAQARGQNQAINDQLNARTISNVVSAERIRELPDESAAAAVSRLPGISLQSGDQIVVRGLEAKFNTVSINGVQLPSTTENRITGLGFISANMLAGIDVSKTVTPAMDANSIGGNVNLRLREAPDGTHYDAFLQGDYNTQDRTAGNYQVWGSASSRFWDGRLGGFLQGNARRFDGGGDIAQATWNPLPQGDVVAGRRPYGLFRYDLQDQVNVVNEYGVSLLLDYRLPRNAGKLVLQNAYSTENFDNVTFNDRLFLTSGNREMRITRTDGSRYLLVNSLQGEHLLAGLGIDWSLSHARSRRSDDLGYETAFIGSNYFQPRSLPEWTSEEQVFDISLTEGNPGSVGDGQTTYEDFGERRLDAVLNLSLPVRVDFLSGQFQAGGKYTKLNRDRDLLQYYRRLADGGGQNEGAADFLRSIGADPSEALQLGVFHDPSYVDGRGSYYLDGRWPYSGAINVDYLDDYFRAAQTGWATPALAQSNRFDYEAEERVAAAYIMGDFDLGYVSILGGVRHETFSFDNRAPYVNQTLYDGQGDVRDTLSVERSKGYWFPNAQLQIKPVEWLDLRLAYTRTTSRPDYQWLLPNTWVDSGERGQAGNPNLRPAISNNLDAYLSIHSNRVGLFTFGVFRKAISDIVRPIQIQRQTLGNFEGTFWAPIDGGYEECEDGRRRITCPDGRLVSDINPVGLIDTYVNNPNEGRLVGFEMDWQTNFWYLPRPFNSLVLNINYTRLSSEMDYQSIQFVNLTPNNPFAPLTQIDTVRVARLYQQADDILNVAVGLDIRGFSGRLSFRYQGEILATLDQRNPADDSFTQPVYSWDFSLRQRLPVQGLSLFFNGVNITHPAGYNNRTLVVGPNATEPSEARTQISYYPRRFQVGIRYSL